MENNQTQIWERLNVFYQTTRKPINVLVAYNADAAAASATVMSLMKASLIPFQTHPIADHEELADTVRDANLAQEVARLDDASPLIDEFFLLIGLGGAVDLRQFFDFARHVVVVLDALRPIHLENLRSEDGERLTLWGSPRIRDEVETFFRDEREQEVKRRRRRRRKAQRRQQRRLRRAYDRTGRPVDGRDGVNPWDAENDDEDDDDADGSSNENSQAGPRLARARRGNDDDAVEDSSADDSEDDDDSDEDDASFDDDESDLASDDGEKDPYVAGFSSQEEPQVHWSERVEADENGLVEDSVAPPMQTLYYASECAGKSCALEAYELAVLLNRLKTPMLWHAAVGVCDLFTRRLIDYGTYLVEMQQIHDAVSLRRQTAQHALEAYSDDIANTMQEGSGGAASAANPQQALQHQQLQARATSNAMQLSNVDEELLYLLRHLSLWDAIWCHPLMASVLRLHHVEDGEGLLSQLLASRCGVSRERAQQPWRELPQDVRRDCLPRVLRELQRLLELSAGGFVKYTTQLRCVARSVGYSTDVSAFDAIHLFEAVLSFAPAPSLYVVEDVDLAIAAADLERGGATAASKTPMEIARHVLRTRLRDFHRQRFWLAHSVLDVDPSEKAFRAAVQDAVDLQRSIADATSALMQPGLLQSTRGVHYVLPQEALKTTAALESFTSVPRLQALGTRLLYTLGVERKRAHVHAMRPLLLSAAVPDPVLRLRGANARMNTGTSSSTMLMMAAAAASAGSGSGSSGGASVDVSSMRSNMREEGTYLIVLVHQGAVRGGLAPVAAVGRFISCVEDEEEFATGLPQRPYVDRHTVLVKGRELATHIVELMHLRSMDRWDPRGEYAARLAAQEEAQRLASYKEGLAATTTHVVDGSEDDENDHGGDGQRGRRGRGSGGSDSRNSNVGLLA